LIAISSLSIKKNKKGIVLLMLVVVLALTVSIYYFSTISVTEIKIDRIKSTKIALNKAKQALIAYAVNYPKDHAPRGPGYLLCPDTNNDGYAESGCNGTATVGRLPWKTLNIGDLRDSANERLWYAVSENFDYTSSPLLKVINTSTAGNITVRDSNNNFANNGFDAAVAVIISPGLALTRDDGTVQDRSNENVAINYLDIDTASGEDNVNFEQGNNNGFIQGDIFDVAGNIIVNDTIEVLTYSDIMGPVHKLVSQEISNLINKYFTDCNAYPEASAFDPEKPTFDSEGQAPPNELRQGHLPLGTALPVDWGVGCAPVPPIWLAGESWHKTSYYVFAFQNAPPANSFSCGDGVVNPSCMTVNSTVSPVNDAQALIMFSGRDLTGSRPSAVMSDYFEVENNNLDSVYDADEIEEYIRVITP